VFVGVVVDENVAVTDVFVVFMSLKYFKIQKI